MTSPRLKLVAFDLDGTLYLGNDAIPGAVSLIQHLRPKYQVVFFTNGSARTSADVHRKLEGLGMQCQLEEVYASSTATAHYLKDEGLDSVFVLGSDSFREEVARLGITVVSDDAAEHVVVGLDSGLDYDRVATALAVLQRGGRFIACNEDRTYPSSGGRLMPGCGAMVGAVAGASGRRPDFIVGKPNTYMLQKIAVTYDVKPEEILVVGDSYESDMAMAQRYGSPGILIGAPGAPVAGGVMVVENLDGVRQRIESLEQ